MKNWRFYIATVVLVAVVTGCAIATRSIPEEDDQNIVGEIVRLKQSTDSSFFEPTILLKGKSGPTKYNGMPAYINWWCVFDPKLEEVKDAASNYCEQIGGAFNAPWCRNESDEPIFYTEAGRAVVTHPDNNGNVCSNGFDVGFWAVTGEEQTKAEWLAVANNKLGYKPMSQLKSETNMLIRNTAIDMLAAQQQILEGGVGTQVCDEVLTKSGPVVRVGFIEKIENSRLKISLNRAYMKNSPSLSPGGFPLGEIWDEPMGWYPCK